MVVLAAKIPRSRAHSCSAGGKLNREEKSGEKMAWSKGEEKKRAGSMSAWLNRAVSAGEQFNTTKSKRGGQRSVTRRLAWPR